MSDDQTSSSSQRRLLSRVLGTDLVALDISRELQEVGAKLEAEIRAGFDGRADAGRHLTQALMDARRAVADIDGHISDQIQNLSQQISSHIELQSAQFADMLWGNRQKQNTYFCRDTAVQAIAVKQYYLQLKALTQPIDFDEIGLSVFSQNNEDGILMYIFSKIGMKTKRCVEIGCDLSASTVGIPEGNTINLITNFAFDGAIIEMDNGKAASIRHFFAQALSTKHLHVPTHGGVPAHYFSPAIVEREVTVANINDILAEAGFSGEIDLLSIDVDGADVSIWNEVDAVSPRMVMIEINARLPLEEVIYGQMSTSTAPKDSLEYQASGSSSLAAACVVAEKKGYVFVGMDATLLNAFFVRRDLWTEALPVKRPQDYGDHRMNPLRRLEISR